MAIINCEVCEGRGHLGGRICGYCDGIGAVESSGGEWLTASERRSPDGVVVAELDCTDTLELYPEPGNGRAA